MENESRISDSPMSKDRHIWIWMPRDCCLGNRGISKYVLRTTVTHVCSGLGRIFCFLNLKPPCLAPGVSPVANWSLSPKLVVKEVQSPRHCSENYPTLKAELLTFKR